MMFKDLLKEETLPKIYIDMDGVLSNWSKAFEDISGGIDADKYEKKHGKNSYWSLIAKEGASFWSNMEWMKDGKKLFKYIKKYKPTILTAPTRDKVGRKYCIAGKHKWMKKELPGVPYIIENDKEKYANDNSLLIDDFIDKINKWENAGGIGIHHKNTNDTISQLKMLGFK